MPERTVQMTGSVGRIEVNYIMLTLRRYLVKTLWRILLISPLIIILNVVMPPRGHRWLGLLSLLLVVSALVGEPLIQRGRSGVEAGSKKQ
jgi:hypothetical protein